MKATPHSRKIYLRDLPGYVSDMMSDTGFKFSEEYEVCHILIILLFPPPPPPPPPPPHPSPPPPLPPPPPPPHPHHLHPPPHPLPLHPPCREYLPSVWIIRKMLL